MIPHSISGRSLTFFANGRMWSVSADHPHFDQIKAQLALSAKGENTLDVDGIIGLFDERHGILKASEGKLDFEGDELVYDGRPVPYVWSDMVMNAKWDKRPFGAILKTLADLMTNPSQIARDRVSAFVEKCRIGFMPDGRLASFHVVKDDYGDVTGRQYVSRVGAQIRADDRGDLIVGALGYIRNNEYDFRAVAENRKIMLVAIWPHDVIGSHSQKLKVKGYEVIDEMDPLFIAEWLGKNRHVVGGYETADAAVSEGPTIIAEQVAAPVQRVSPFRRRNRQAA